MQARLRHSRKNEPIDNITYKCNFLIIKSDPLLNMHKISK